jgi:hypothetical protein
LLGQNVYKRIVQLLDVVVRIVNGSEVEKKISRTTVHAKSEPGEQNVIRVAETYKVIRAALHLSGYAFAFH